jgi:hypothetical protein
MPRRKLILYLIHLAPPGEARTLAPLKLLIEAFQGMATTFNRTRAKVRVHRDPTIPVEGVAPMQAR